MVSLYPSLPQPELPPMVSVALMALRWTAAGMMEAKKGFEG
jgi:hypothetical protein